MLGIVAIVLQEPRAELKGLWYKEEGKWVNKGLWKRIKWVK